MSGKRVLRTREKQLKSSLLRCVLLHTDRCKFRVPLLPVRDFEVFNPLNRVFATMDRAFQRAGLRSTVSTDQLQPARPHLRLQQTLSRQRESSSRCTRRRITWVPTALWQSSREPTPDKQSWTSKSHHLPELCNSNVENCSLRLKRLIGCMHALLSCLSILPLC